MNYTTLFMATIIASNVYAMEYDESLQMPKWIQENQISIDDGVIVPSHTSLTFLDIMRYYDEFTVSSLGAIACRSNDGSTPSYLYSTKLQPNASLHVAKLKNSSENHINVLTFNKNGTQLYAGDNFGHLLAWHLTDDQCTFRTGYARNLTSINALDTHSLENTPMMACGHLNGISLWNTDIHHYVRFRQTEHSVEHVKYLSNSERIIAYGDKPDSLHIYNKNLFITDSITNCGKSNMGGLAVSHDNVHIAVHNGGHRGTLFLFDIRNTKAPVHAWHNDKFFSLDDTLFFTDNSLCKAGISGITTYNLHTFEQHETSLPRSEKPVWNKWNNNLYRFEKSTKQCCPTALLTYDCSDLIKKAHNNQQDNCASGQTLRDMKSSFEIINLVCALINGALPANVKQTIRTTLASNLQAIFADENAAHYDKTQIMQKIFQELPDDAHCPICLDVYKDLFALAIAEDYIKTTAGTIYSLIRCDHMLCDRCYTSMRNKGMMQCPLCMTDFFNL